MSLMIGVLAWRTTFGGLNALDSRSGTMILGFPEWIVYAVMVLPMVLTAVIALVQVFSPGDHAPQGDSA
jgi:TRAP-type C4-dicarboxylate transport system permease small subunit